MKRYQYPNGWNLPVRSALGVVAGDYRRAFRSMGPSALISLGVRLLWGRFRHQSPRKALGQWFTAYGYMTNGYIMARRDMRREQEAAGVVLRAAVEAALARRAQQARDPYAYWPPEARPPRAPLRRSN